MKKITFIFAGFVATTLLISCREVDLAFVKSSEWLWQSGYKIGDGDHVDFDSDFYTLSNDTIYRKGIPKCVVVRTDKKNYEMVVRSLEGKTGHYANTEEFTK